MSSEPMHKVILADGTELIADVAIANRHELWIMTEEPCTDSEKIKTLFDTMMNPEKTATIQRYALGEVTNTFTGFIKMTAFKVGHDDIIDIRMEKE